LDGFKAQADYGQTQSHDGGDTHFSLGYGHDLGDRTHFIIGAEYENAEDIGLCSRVRDWCKNAPALYTNTQYAANGGNGQPHYVIGPNATAANSTQTGVLTPCNVATPVCIPFGPQYVFNAAGNAATPYNPGLYADGASTFGYSQGANPGV